ncbi:membrane protein [Planomonospora venezuelensis]|nr:membrane protein [Planomonospora venezuelensis]
MSALEILVALAIAVGIAGIIVPVLPGTILVLAAILVWALEIGTSTGWAVFAVATLCLVVGSVVKYLVPGRHLKAAGVPTRTLVAGGVLAFVGFFVVPVIGMFIGFVLGVYVAERARVGGALAWPSTKGALRAVGVSIVIELVAAFLAAAAWAAGVAAT